MHTKLSEFLQWIKNAAIEKAPQKQMTMIGMENVRTAKLQSLRTGRIIKAVEEIAGDEDVDHIEFIVCSRAPETMHTVIIKGIGKEGKGNKAIVETIDMLVPTEDIYLYDCDEILDRRPMMSVYTKI
jgi:hypothetical protein